MPSYKNFRNSYRRRTEQDDVFKNPRNTRSSTISEEKRNNLIDWVTFYRRNVHRFIEHYLGIKLHPYQIIWVYMMSISDSFAAICSRAVGKTWLLAVFACAKAILYPNSEIVVVSSTKEQAGLLIEKIKGLQSGQPNLNRELINVVTNMNQREATFRNGSTIKVVASRESSRGRRSTFTIYEEFVLIDLEILNSVIRPFSYIRPVPYLQNDLYKHLIEEYKEVFISSAYHKGLWWFDEVKRIIKSTIREEGSNFIAIDFSVAVRHHIKTWKNIKKDIASMDEITALEQIYNCPWGESSSAFFRLKMFDRSRTIKKAFYPQRIETFNAKKNPYAIPKIEGEIRLLSCDIASRSGKENDLSITGCIRLLPSHRGFIRELLHIESYSGRDSINQTIRIKQIFYDFEADFIVLDVQNVGITIYEQLGVVNTDPERGIQFPPMTVMQHETIDADTYAELTKKTLSLNALPVIYPISATAKLNSLIAVQLRDKLQRKMWNFLVDETTADECLIRGPYKTEYLKTEDGGAKSFFQAGFCQTSLLINECINLSKVIHLGYIKLEEPSGARRDRYSMLAYGNHYACLLDQELIREEDNEDDFDFIVKLIQSA